MYKHLLSTNQIASIVVGALFLVAGCASSPPPATPTAKVPPALPLSNEDRAVLGGSSPDVVRAVQRLIAAERRARGRGEAESAEALALAIDRLLASSQDVKRARQNWNRCEENQNALNSMLSTMIQSDPTKTSATPAAQPKLRSKAASASLQKKAEAVEAPDSELTPRIRKLAKNLELLEGDPKGPAPKARLETVRQIVLDANRAATKGAFAEASRLADRGEKLLDPSLQRETMTRDEALKQDVQRIMGKRVTLENTGVLVHIADRGEPARQSVMKRLEEILRVYRVNPVARLGREPGNTPAVQAVDALLQQDQSTSRRAPQSQPDSNRDGVWLWIGYTS